jgi:type VI secretion system protein ImpM
MPQMMYFGKIPARRDFIRANVPVPIAAVIDNWISQGLELLVADPEWKQKYDRTEPIRFLFTRTRAKRAIAGSMVSSQDHTERRYPFLVFTVWDNLSSGPFVQRSPLLLNRCWHTTAGWAVEAVRSPDPVKTLLEIEDEQRTLDVPYEAYDASYNDFLELTTLQRLSVLLPDSSLAKLRQTILGLALLLQPLRMNNGGVMYRGFSLPVPDDPLYSALAAAMWQDLLSVFVANGDYEIAIYLYKQHNHQRCVVNLAGPTAHTFQALFDGAGGEDAIIDLSHANWVDNQSHLEYGARKLDNFLAYPDLTLKRLVQTFKEVHSTK